MTMVPEMATALPVAGVAPLVCDALAENRRAVLMASPGSGKTTGIPLFLLFDERFSHGKILILSPRRVAARAAASRMATALGESVGKTVGYQIRMEKKVSSSTRILVVTEGIFTRRIQSDPELSGISVVIFDEFHERHLDTDIGLAFALDAAEGLRDDLAILVMSATLDSAVTKKVMGDAKEITCNTTPFRVSLSHLVPEDRRPKPVAIAKAVAAAVLSGITKTEGDILCFLPGIGEIRHCQARLEGKTGSVPVLALHGGLSPSDQETILSPAGGSRVILSTSIAETSLTLPKVTLVVDSGWARRPVLDPASKMERLETVRVSLAEATQRTGRAGRVQEGKCIRLWPENETMGLVAQAKPEILRLDPIRLLLEASEWGARPEALMLADLPEAHLLERSERALSRMGAFSAGRITEHGKKMVAAGLQPRLSHMLIRGMETESGGLAAHLAAFLSERVPFSKDPDLASRVQAVMRERGGLGERVRKQAELLLKRVGGKRESGQMQWEAIGPLLAESWPERIAVVSQDAQGRYLLAEGGSVRTDPETLRKLGTAIVAMDAGSGTDPVLRLGALLPADFIETRFRGSIRKEASVVYDPERRRVVGSSESRFEAIVLKRTPMTRISQDEVGEAVCTALRERGLSLLPWEKASRALAKSHAICRHLEKQAGRVSRRER